MDVKVSDYSGLSVSLLGKLSRLSSRFLEQGLEAQGLSLQEFRIVGLMLGEKAINQKQLAEKMFVKPATLSVAINKLEAKGAIERHVSKQDKRVNFLKLSKKLDFKKTSSVIASAEERLCRGIASKELKIAQKVMKQMIENLETEPFLNKK